MKTYFWTIFLDNILDNIFGQYFWTIFWTIFFKKFNNKGLSSPYTYLFIPYFCLTLPQTSYIFGNTLQNKNYIFMIQNDCNFCDQILQLFEIKNSNF